MMRLYWQPPITGAVIADSDVRYPVANGASFGTCRVPDKATVRRGTLVDVSDEGTFPIIEPE